ncbi:hypothetical protein AK812_SmicGene26233 [Symbiodinium microadriaticum]|uniref:Uncharacterized protein n=1 Tax=Symbiodinium microadriaticum TaxID=2951 RepID=A0A1Q9D9X5_SYMMI|nr:hypothetical protein AK812_SmicGene26233 [Symbiodinium microadriaticum]
MGGKKSWNQGDYGSRQHGGSWGYWRGSYQARSPRSMFPAYDQGRQDAWHTSTRDSEPTEAQTFTQALQGSLNGTRKVEQRVVSLQSGLVRRQSMWESYLRDMKEALRREQARFVKDMEKLRTDLAQAMQQQEDARAELVRVAALAGRAPERPPPDSRVDRVFDAWCSEEPDNDAHAVLRRAMAATGEGHLIPQASHTGPPVRTTGPPPGLSAPPPPPSSDADAFMTEMDALAGNLSGPEAPGLNPTPGTSGPGGMPPAEHGPYAGFVTRDPYLPSPGQAALRPRLMSVSPRARPGPYERTEEEEALRGGPAAANALAATLAATRAATPFSSGIPPNMGSLRSIDPTKHPVPTFIQDDDELAAPPDPGGMVLTRPDPPASDVVGSAMSSDSFERFREVAAEVREASLREACEQVVHTLQRAESSLSGTEGHNVPGTSAGIDEGGADFEDLSVDLVDARDQHTQVPGVTKLLPVLLAAPGYPLETVWVGTTLPCQKRDQGYDFVHGEVLTLALARFDSKVKEAVAVLDHCPPQIRTPSYTAHRVALSGRAGDDNRITLPTLRDIADRSPERPQGPAFEVDPPLVLPAQPLILLRGLFVILAERYKPEVIPLDLRMPVDIASAREAIQEVRLPLCKHRFPYLIPVPYQPCSQFAIFLAAPAWTKNEIEVAFDCRGIGGMLHSKCVPTLLSFQQLCDAAGVAPWLPVEVWVEPFREPVQPHRSLRLYAGSLVIFRNEGAGCPELQHLMDMLRSATGWDQLADLPFSFDPAVWILADDGPFRFLIEPEQGGLGRQAVAQALDCDPARLTLVPPEPPIRDLSHIGLCASAVLIVSRDLPNLRGPRFGPCAVFLDLRPLLADLSWMVCPDGLFHLSAFVATIPRRCPPGFKVVVWGAFPVPGTDQYRVADGTKLTFTYELIPPNPQRTGLDEDTSDSGSEAPASSRHTMMSDSSSADSDDFDDSPSRLPAGPPPPGPPHRTTCAGKHLLACFALHSFLIVQPAAATHVLHPQVPIASVLGYVVAVDLWLRALVVSYAALWLPFWSSALCGHVCRLLCDLASGCPRSNEAYQALRAANRLLAIPWPLAPLYAFEPEVQDADEDDDPMQPIMMNISCVILKPEYVPERVNISLHMPCTLGEIMDALQASRSTPDFVRFPHLLHANPQPIRGLAVFVALPRWHPTATVICLNTAAIDGRIFATYAPDRLNVADLCWLADLPTQVNYVVYVAGDDQPLPPDLQVHIASGDHVVFLESEDIPLTDLALPAMLLRLDLWRRPGRFPDPRVREAYCLALRDHQILHIEDFSRPFRFKSRLAHSAGLTPDRFHVLHADPAIHNIALFGVPCRALLAACTCGRGEQECLGIFFDLRPIQEGVRFVCRSSTSFDLAPITEAFDAGAPIGWRTQLQAYGQTTEETPEVWSGITFIADYVPCVGPGGQPVFARAEYDTGLSPIEADAEETPQDNSAPTGFQITSHPSSEAEGVQSGGAIEPPAAQGSTGRSSSSQNFEDGGGNAGGASNDHPGLHQPASTTGASGSQPLPFLIFSVEYKPEGIFPGLAPPLNQSAAIAVIAQLRAPSDHRRTPRLLPANPQPPHMPAVLLALPYWPTESVTILFDCHVTARRTFAEAVPRFFSRSDVLTMANIDPSTPCHVFHRDVPWPIPEGYWIYPTEGDWIGIFPEGDQPGPLPTLRQYLYGDVPTTRARGDLWDSDIAWVLSDGPQVAVPIPEDSFAINSSQAAAALGLHPGRFILVPAAPELADHAHRGQPSRRVLLAKQTDDSDEDGGRESERVPYILDLRPVQLYLCQAAAPEGMVDVAEICQRLMIRCPRGFHVRLYGGTFADDVGNHTRRVQAGDIISVEYHPDYVREVVSQLEPGTYSPGTSITDSQGSAQGTHQESTSSAYSGSADAGTGGSATVNRYPFYLAATLVDALCAHFAPPSANRSLAHLLRSPANVMDYADLCQVCPAASSICWLDAFQDFRHLVPAHGLVVYTDGSFTPEHDSPAKAGWAAIFLDPHQETLSAAFGPVITFPTDTTVLSPYVAECYALMAAALISTVAYHDRPIAFLSDCVAAVGVSAGKMTFQLGGDVYHHVPGHCGFAGNEMADRESTMPTEDTHDGVRAQHFALRAVTLGLAYQPARAALLAEQLLGHNIHVAFLQETRAEPSSTKVSVHAHAAIITKHVQDGLQRVAGSQAARPHHAYLSDATWQLQRAVSKLRRQFHQLSHRLHSCDIAASFCAWARGVPLRVILFRGCRWQAQAERAKHAMQLELHTQCTLLRKACRRDRDAYISQLAETISTAPSKDAFAAYHAILAHRRKKVCSPDPLPQVLDAQGAICPDAPSMRRRWREHFAALEGGQDTTFQTIALQAAHGTPSPQPTHPPTISDVPSLPDLCRVLAATKVGKATGMDSIPAEVNRAFTQEVAEVLFPILLKMLWRGAEPAGYKGGQAIIMYKGRGQTSACTSYRSILLMNTWAKTLHQSVRPIVRDVFEQTAPALQLGGRSGCSVTFGSHILRGTFRCAHRDNTPAFVLFADISAAFYSALVQLVAHSPSTTSPEGLRTALQGLTLPDEVVEELRAHLQEPSALSQSSTSSWLEHLAAHIGERNWFVIAGDSVPIATGRGTRPGSSWADVLFALLMPKVLRRRDALLESMGATPVRPTFHWDGEQALTPCADDCPSIPVDEVVWADDIAIPRLCPLVSAMTRAVRAEATALTEAFLSFGFRLAFGEHKTAAVVSVCGPGSRVVKRSIYSHDGLQGQLPVLFEHLEAMKLPLPPKYKHLGVLQTPTGSILEEIRLRRHLISAPRCLANWGIFQPTAAACKYQPHAMAPPTAVPGRTLPPPAFDFAPAISTTLLGDLNTLCDCPEDEVWEVLESHIEPLQTLRATVMRWRDVDTPSAWRVEMAENMLLLLDPDVVAESRQPATDKAGQQPELHSAWRASGEDSTAWE